MQWRPSSIPRTTYQAKRCIQVLDGYNRPTTTCTEFTVEDAGAPQPVTGDDAVVVPEGFRNRSIYRIFTTTELRCVEQYSALEADQVFIAPFWYTVVKVHAWTYGIRSHYEVFVSKNTDQ